MSSPVVAEYTPPSPGRGTLIPRRWRGWTLGLPEALWVHHRFRQGTTYLALSDRLRVIGMLIPVGTIVMVTTGAVLYSLLDGWAIEVRR